MQVTTYTRAMQTVIKPALTPDEWNQRRAGAVSVEVVDAETHVAVRDPDGEVVSISGDDALFAAMALTNCAMTDDDPRKLCRTDLAVLSVLTEEYHRQANGDRQILLLATVLFDKLAALLPGTGVPARPTGEDAPTSQR